MRRLVRQVKLLVVPLVSFCLAREYDPREKEKKFWRQVSEKAR